MKPLQVAATCLAFMVNATWAQCATGVSSGGGNCVPPDAPGVQGYGKGSKMDDLKSFAAGGAKIVESISGDLEGDGSTGVVLVLDPPDKAAPAPGEGPNRLVKILVRDEAGKLRETASNAHLVPCATCGGIAGDPYGYTRIERGSFTIAIGGGSRERWSDEFTFTYVAARKDWFVTHVVRNIEDQDTGKHKTVELDRADLGDVSFGDFDPTRLPEAALP